MSYAKALVSMSRGAIAPVTTESIHEEHVEAEAPVMTAPAPVGAAAAPTVPVVRPQPRRDAPLATTGASTHVIERRETEIEHARDVPTPASIVPEPPIVATHTIERERVVMPAAPAWLAEDPSAPDPLVASADTDALRDLLRSVRQWTASEPTVLALEPAVEHTVVSPTVAPADPVQVSIGNVVITVEDAPPASRGTTHAPARAASDRLARNHIRGT